MALDIIQQARQIQVGRQRLANLVEQVQLAQIVLGVAQHGQLIGLAAQRAHQQHHHILAGASGLGSLDIALAHHQMQQANRLVAAAQRQLHQLKVIVERIVADRRLAAFVAAGKHLARLGDHARGILIERAALDRQQLIVRRLVDQRAGLCGPEGHQALQRGAQQPWDILVPTGRKQLAERLEMALVDRHGRHAEPHSGD